MSTRQHDPTMALFDDAVQCLQAAVRGLQEELGITAEPASLQGPLVPVHLRRLEAPEIGVTDCEFVTSFRSALLRQRVPQFQPHPHV